MESNVFISTPEAIYILKFETINFTEDDIIVVIRKLNPNKVHGQDQISIRMLQICDKAICKPLYLIFFSCIDSGIFQIEWKFANMVPISKPNDKQC